MAIEPSNDRRQVASAWPEVQSEPASASPMAKGMTRASVVMSAAGASPSGTARISSWLSTSPLNAAMT
jgi:hypothetical protein